MYLRACGLHPWVPGPVLEDVVRFHWGMMRANGRRVVAKPEATAGPMSTMRESRLRPGRLPEACVSLGVVRATSRGVSRSGTMHSFPTT